MSKRERTPEITEPQPNTTTLTAGTLLSTDEYLWKTSLEAARSIGPDTVEAALDRYLDFLDHDDANVYELSAFDVENKDAIKDAGGWRRGANLIAYAKGRDEVQRLTRLGLDFGAEALYLVSGKSIPTVGMAYKGRNAWYVMETHTTDEQILERRVLPFDLDPAREPRERSATDDEHRLALRAGKLLTCYLWSLLDRLGKSRTCLAYGPSGNGFHCLLAVSILEAPEVSGLYTSILDAARRRVRAWIHEGVDVDLTLSNASRLLPIYGTKKCKGGEYPDEKIRHRWSYLAAQRPTERLTLDDLRALLEVLLEGLPAEAELKTGAPTAPAGPSPVTTDDWQAYRNAIDAIPMAKVLEHVGLLDDSGKPICPGHGEPAAHGTDVAIISSRDGRVELLNCKHARCVGKGNCKSTKGTNWTGVGLVMNRRDCDVRTARDILGKAFDVPKPKGRPPEDPATTDELLRMADGAGTEDGSAPEEGAAQTEPEASEPETPKPRAAFSGRRRACTDQGNAERVFDLFGAQVGYLDGGTWLVWDGKRFERYKNDVKVQALVKRANRSIYLEAAQTEGNARRRLQNWAKKSEGARSIAASIRLLRDLVLLDEDDLDTHPELLNCQNGVVCLKTGALLPHDPKYKLTQITRGNYDPSKPSNLMIAHLERCQPDPEVRAYIWRSAGYQITGLIREHYYEIHTGSGKDDEEGRNGKGTFYNAISWALGDYAGAPPRDLLAQKPGEFDKHPTGFMTVKKKRLCVTSEFERGQVLNVANGKILTGGDPIVGRGMRQDFGDPFWPTHKLVLVTNWLIRIPDTDAAIWERVRVIRWPVYLQREARVLDALDKLRTQEEVDGIITLLVQGCLEWQRAGQKTSPPQSVLDDTQKYRDAENEFGQFVDEHLAKTPGGKVNRKHVYERYKAWCAESGKKPLSAGNFAKELVKRKVVEVGPGDKSGNERFWLGVTLVDDVKARFDADSAENERQLRAAGYLPTEAANETAAASVAADDDLDLEAYVEGELARANGQDAAWN
ncbi:MAG TPA: phage/plasmid primase, P4 family [Polyangiaceae bacterium]|nr:phage/plasmid primase, P4 family [Polyangiaceae bacterium]